MEKPHHHHRIATLRSTKADHIYIDDEFGEIRYRRVGTSRHVRIRMSTSGRLQATLPLFAPLSALGKLIDNSRVELRNISTKSMSSYVDGQTIGHSHTLHLLPNTNGLFRGAIAKQKITLSYPTELSPNGNRVQTEIRNYVAKALRKESRAYLPRRLQYIAERGGFKYDKVRFAHQSSRWGSCSSSGTISLNIALMNLTFEEIDYVLIHELAHTLQMNHSTAFWDIVAQHCPNYKSIRKSLKLHNPYL